jgi:hypothetical protein
LRTWTVACTPENTAAARVIASFSASQLRSVSSNCSSCLGVRPTGNGLEVFAPFGLADLFAMRTRPNPVLAPAAVYEAKTSRWLKEWPQLTVLPWPAR